MKKLITLLENLSGKKIILEDSVFKPRKLDERLLPVKKELEKHMTIDENRKTIVIEKEGVNYSECLVLEKFYQGYMIDVNGSVNVSNCGLSELPHVNFNKVEWNFGCARNHLTSLKYCPTTVMCNFYCDDNDKQFTDEEVLRRCDVGDQIIC
jgi:hypothetical protein